MLRTYASTLVLCLLFVGPIAFVAPAGAAAPDPNLSQVTSNGGLVSLLPSGAFGGLSPGTEIFVSLVDVNGQPCTGLPASDFEVDAFGTPQTMADAFFPGNGAHDCPPGSVTEIQPGRYRIAGPLYAGGQAFQGFFVRVQGVTLGNGVPTSHVGVGPDITSDGVCDLADIGAFAFCVIQGVYDRRCDTNADGIINLLDIGNFAQWALAGSLPAGAIVDPVD